MNSPWPCGICHKRVAKNHNAVCCDVCNQWVHISCNNITRYTYSKLQKEQAPWYCKKCIKNTIPYSKLSDTQLEKLMTGKLLTSPKLTIEKSKIIFPSDDCENVIKNELYTPESFYKIDADQNSDNLFIHMNISSISYHIDNSTAFMNNCKIKPKVIGLSESRLRKNRQPLSNINLENYVYESTPTESFKGGTMLYVDKQLTYRLRKDLMIYKSREIESTFIGLVNNNNSNTVLGCIYKRPKVSVTEFMEDYLNPLLEKLAKEKIETILMGDFNINISNCNTDRDTSSFIDTI